MNLLYISFPDINGSEGSSTHVREILRNLSTNNSITVVSPTKYPPNFGSNVIFKRAGYLDVELLRAFTFSINAFLFVSFIYLEINVTLFMREIILLGLVVTYLCYLKFQ